jgi:hypothetical protein
MWVWGKTKPQLTVSRAQMHTQTAQQVIPRLHCEKAIQSKPGRLLFTYSRFPFVRAWLPLPRPRAAREREGGARSEPGPQGRRALGKKGGGRSSLCVVGGKHVVPRSSLDLHHPPCSTMLHPTRLFTLPLLLLRRGRLSVKGNGSCQSNMGLLHDIRPPI